MDRLSQSFARARDNANVDRIVAHRDAIHRQPKRVRGDAAQRYDTRSMIREINLEMTREHFWPWRLDRVLCFGLGCGNLDPPPTASMDQGLAEDQTCKVSQAKLTAGECRDQQSIAVGPEPA